MIRRETRVWVAFYCHEIKIRLTRALRHTSCRNGGAPEDPGLRFFLLLCLLSPSACCPLSSALAGVGNSLSALIFPLKPPPQSIFVCSLLKAESRIIKAWLFIWKVFPGSKNEGLGGWRQGRRQSPCQVCCWSRCSEQWGLHPTGASGGMQMPPRASLSGMCREYEQLFTVSCPACVKGDTAVHTSCIPGRVVSGRTNFCGT